MESIIEAALVGDKNYYAQSISSPDGSTLVAFPLRKSDAGPVAAIVIYRIQPVAFATPSNLYIYQTFFLVMMLIMFLIAVPVGAVFGWLVTRDLRREEVNPFTELSEREFDVLRLIAAGRSNAEIASTLIIGESTVKTHIGNIIKKLHVEDRTQAAVYAWQEGIVRRGQSGKQGGAQERIGCSK